ncbi:Flp pilus assembly protein CpaB [Sphingomonas panacisoli]|uniref:Flp pilus assembly protein CpaB n=1 Tax=Sphingomonas panacisoli TaxID=1813879 RepID=A0A5B8LFS6_9SPHN|nr:Flp pilus assembly protein CpaB [Sphingomonas panacisoli]QDZ06512.1 Flp pilus assembly protein CpaB [Sphingomonas panacisoli]
MDSRKIILLVGALVVAAITAFMARSLISGSSAPQAQAQMAPPIVGTEVLVATKTLPVGTILDATSFKYQPWPNEMVGGAYFVKKDGFDIKSLQGTVVRTVITAGQPLTQGALVKPGDRGFLAAALTPGMRAVTFPVENKNSVAGFVFPGDHIDLMLTQKVAGGGDGPALNVAETIMKNLRVLATDQRTTTDVDDQGKTVVKNISMVTIEATPSIAEKISVARALGDLSIVLRPLADSASELDAAIADGSVKVPDGKDPKAEKAILDAAANQPSAGKTTFATGADVSRFQRRTVPGKAESPYGRSGGNGGYPGTTTGPTVRIARGNNVTEIPVGGKK